MIRIRKIALFSLLCPIFGVVIWKSAKAKSSVPILGSDLQKHALSLKLARACAYGKSREVQTLLNRGANPDARDAEDGVPTIFRAMRNEDYAVVTSLLKAGANVNIYRDARHSTPLMYAAAFLDAKMIRILLKNGANLEMKDSIGGTALSHAANSCGGCGCESNEETGRELIKQGANVNARDNKGDTPLMLLAMEPNNGAVKLAKALLANGAQAKWKNKDGKTAMQICQKSGGVVSTELVRLLRESPR